LSDCKGHITRHGHPRLRFLLSQAAWNWTRHDPQAAAWYQRQRQATKKLHGAAMRRLGILRWHRALAAQATIATPSA
jgi:hypothetical protein